MAQPQDALYDDMAAVYHLIYDDWDVAVRHQGEVLARLLLPPDAAGRVLDCACGIGTQTLGLAEAGYAVEGTDLSAAAIGRARAEAAARGMNIAFRVDDMGALATSPAATFGAVIACDNALPHLDSDAAISGALRAMRDRLRPGGRLLLSLRDYGPIMAQRPAITPPALFRDAGRRRIVHQVWDWQDERRYILHLYITRQMPDDTWACHHFTGHYRATTPAKVAALAEHAGFRRLRILQPAETGYHQPIVTAERD